MQYLGWTTKSGTRDMILRNVHSRVYKHRRHVEAHPEDSLGIDFSESSRGLYRVISRTGGIKQTDTPPRGCYTRGPTSLDAIPVRGRRCGVWRTEEGASARGVGKRSAPFHALVGRQPSAGDAGAGGRRHDHGSWSPTKWASPPTSPSPTRSCSWTAARCSVPPPAAVRRPSQARGAGVGRQLRPRARSMTCSTISVGPGSLSKIA